MFGAEVGVSLASPVAALALAISLAAGIGVAFCARVAGSERQIVARSPNTTIAARITTSTAASSMNVCHHVRGGGGSTYGGGHMFGGGASVGGVSRTSAGS